MSWSADCQSISPAQFLVITLDASSHWFSWRTRHLPSARSDEVGYRCHTHRARCRLRPTIQLVVGRRARRLEPIELTTVLVTTAALCISKTRSQAYTTEDQDCDPIGTQAYAHSLIANLLLSTATCCATRRRRFRPTYRRRPMHTKQKLGLYLLATVNNCSIHNNQSDHSLCFTSFPWYELTSWIYMHNTVNTPICIIV